MTDAIQSETHAKWTHLPARPWKYTGCTREVYQACHGAPIQPGTSCDHCGTGIAEVHNFLSVETGKTFKVGSSCVYKMLAEMQCKALTAAEVAIRKARNKAARARAAKKKANDRETAAALLTEHATLFATLPHPRGFYGKTLADFATWMLANGGGPAAKQVVAALTAALPAE